MSNQTESLTTNSWPRHLNKSVETRKRDVVIRLTDWTHDEDEPAYDVEVYEHGVYDWNESKVFSTKGGKPKAREAAIAFASAQFTKFVH